MFLHLTINDVKWKEHKSIWNKEYMSSHSAVTNSLWPHGFWPSRLLCSWYFASKNSGVGCYFFLQGIFLTPELNSYLQHLLHWQADSLPFEPPGKPKEYIYIYIYEYIHKNMNIYEHIYNNIYIYHKIMTKRIDNDKAKHFIIIK